MATDSTEQDFCRILVLSDDGSTTAHSQCMAQLENKACVDASVICHKPVNMESSNSFPSCVVTVDIEKGLGDVSKIDQDTCGSIKTEISLTKPLRRQNSLQSGKKTIPPLINHVLMFLKLDAKEKQTLEKPHDAINNRPRKCKRAGLFHSRRIVLLFSIVSSIGTLVLILLTLRVRRFGDSYVHG
ncbi:uncharacterized protein LOC130809016 [Amaranthus tricolor]|uniref:uncharacterized protein LOC130809016 n=1 Tax=Amaranthus tricolor TaxID=29722 RepID=UPI002587F1D9|nr:uncharacterized protein LOC130809016 [Amaranthus tricolor]